MMQSRDACRVSNSGVAKLVPEFARKATINEEEELKVQLVLLRKARYFRLLQFQSFTCSTFINLK